MMASSRTRLAVLGLLAVLHPSARSQTLRLQYRENLAAPPSILPGAAFSVSRLEGFKVSTLEDLVRVENPVRTPAVQIISDQKQRPAKLLSDSPSLLSAHETATAVTAADNSGQPSTSLNSVLDHLYSGGNATTDAAVPPDFGAKNGTEISNKATILQEVDRTLGRSRPPALEYIFVRPLVLSKFSRGSGSGTNPYGHAVMRYTLPDGRQKVMNIVGAPGRSMVNFLSPEDYLYGTGVFDTGSEQGGVYNRSMFSLRVEELPDEKLLALDRYYTELKIRAKTKQVGFSLALAKIKNLINRFFPGTHREWGNCALWSSNGLVAAGILDAPTFWPKEIWVKLYETYRALDSSNVHGVYYRRIAHAAHSYGKSAAHMPEFVAPFHWIKSYHYRDLGHFSDVVVEVPEGSLHAQVSRPAGSSAQ